MDIDRLANHLYKCAKRLLTKKSTIREARIACDDMLAIQYYQRKFKQWRLIDVTHLFNIHNVIPHELQAFIASNPNVVLAGGALHSIYHDCEPNDYDLFIFDPDKTPSSTDYAQHKLANSICNDFINTFKGCHIIEMPHVIDVQCGITPYQLIKRVYDSMDKIIGGFDLDPCRMLYDGDRVYTTITGALYIKYNEYPFDIESQSKNFAHRLIKYGYNTLSSMHECMHLNLSTRSVLLKCLGRYHDHDYGYTGTFSISAHLTCVLDKKRSICWKYGAKPYSYETLKQKLITKFGNICGLQYIIKHVGIDYKITAKTPVDKYKELITRVLNAFDKGYKEYVKLFECRTFMVRNPGRQHTSSFHKTNYTTIEFYEKHLSRHYIDYTYNPIHVGAPWSLLRACELIRYFHNAPPRRNQLLTKRICNLVWCIIMRYVVVNWIDTTFAEHYQL